jgi:hypothetical protein
MSVNGTSRIQTPRPERVEPLRTFGTLLGRTPSSADQTGSDHAPLSQVERGVRAGYEVIAEYLNEGRSSARTFADSEPQASVPASLEQLTERMFQHASDLGSVWMDLLRTLNRRQNDASAEPLAGFSTNGARGGVASDQAPGEASSPSHGVGELPVSVIVSSPLPVQVDVRLHGAPPAAFGVAVHAPRRAGDDRVLRGVTLEWRPAENRLVTCLSLEAEVEPGTYTGVLVARESNVPFGTLCVVVQSKLEVPVADQPR